MTLIRHKPTTSSQRFKISIDRAELWKGGPLKKLCSGINSNQGRNNQGRITVRHKGGGAQRKVYRMIDFKPTHLDMEAYIERIEYDPNRTAFIALIKYENGDQRYMLAAQGNKQGDKIVHSSKSGYVSLGCSMPLRYIPTGTKVFNIEIKPKKGGQMMRSAGAYATLLAKEGSYALLRLRSGEIRKFLMDCRAYIGIPSNIDNQNTSLGKAGASRKLGIRPTVRGVAMNPIDHPHGGGEGKTSSGRHPVTPWGQKTKGLKTRRRPLSPLVVSTRHKNRVKK